MSILSRPSFAPSTAIIYITAGALLDVWTTVYYLSFSHEGTPEAKQMTGFWLGGFFLTGLILMIIGFAIGRIGRAARQAELPPTEATPTVAQTDINAANRPVVVPLATQATTLPPNPVGSIPPVDGTPHVVVSRQ
jgi:hypothetical protein